VKEKSHGKFFVFSKEKIFPQTRKEILGEEKGFPQAGE
jgi:hypothetical protein